MKVYLAGKITGDSNYREKFAAAAKKLEERAGVTVIYPAVTPEGLKKADYSVKHIALYYKAIPGMLRLLRQERAELEGNYYGLRGLACDGMPRGSSPGKPTEESGLRALENGVSERLAEIAETERVLSGDEACIRACLDALNGKYKEVIVMRYVRGYSWAKISARLGTADSTARDWHTRAMERLGEVLEELPEAEALARRASRART